MIERVFLGWDRPFLNVAVEWLLERRDELPTMLLVVPTAQSGRTLREALAVAAVALLSPKVVTPGSFLQARNDEAAANWVEQVAWVEVLENITDWSDYEALFSQPPGEGTNWASGLAREMFQLRHTLQENGLLLTIASRKLSETVEADRWAALAKLEQLVEQKFNEWGLKSRSKILTNGIRLPTGFTKIVLVGIAEMPPLVERAVIASEQSLTTLIGAPECESQEFSITGKPSTTWSQRPMPWPNGLVQVAADPRQQALEALEIIATSQTTSDQLALAAVDTEVGDELARTLTREGWPAFHPATNVSKHGLFRWFKIWGEWLTDPTLATLADLLTLPETGILIAGKRAQKAKCLAKLRDCWMITRTEDLQRRIAQEKFKSEWDKESAEELCKAAEALEKWRSSLQSEKFIDSLNILLAIIARTEPSNEDVASIMTEWLANAAPMVARVKRSAGFWIELMLSEIPSPPPIPPVGRVIDVQGWLEIYHEPGSHLILCGMNDSKVPARSGGEPWLSETSREILGLIKDADRASRDAFLYHSMVKSRLMNGRVDVICGKSGSGGEPMMPSRLLLAATRNELPDRVRQLFHKIEPPDASLRWQKDWQWVPRKADPPARINATSFTDYLTCPLRYYLKHVIKMQTPETTRTEWNARDFGNVAHEVLERWGRDTVARELALPEPIQDWLSAELDRVVIEWFGTRVPLAVRIQTESLRKRLEWMAQVQAANRLNGWIVIDVERKEELKFGDAVIIVKIDRIDRHCETGQLRVIDYKTGKVEGVEKSHRKKLTLASKLPPHIGDQCPAIQSIISDDKLVSFLWTNLQLPLYAAALVAKNEAIPAPCYFTLGSTKADVAIHEWSKFDSSDLESAKNCATWVINQINDEVFWPPAEKVKYDDFAVLAAGRKLDEMFVKHP